MIRPFVSTPRFAVPLLDRRLVDPYLRQPCSYCLNPLPGAATGQVELRALARGLRRRRPELWQWLEEERVRQAIATGSIRPIEDMLETALEQYLERRGHAVISARLWAALEYASEASGVSPAEIVQAAIVAKFA